MDGFVIFLMYFIVFGSIGMLIGQKKGRVMAGLIWAMLLGPIGWLLVFMGPDANAPKAAKCPICAGVVPVNQGQCNHCKNSLTWIKGKPYRPLRAA